MATWNFNEVSTIIASSGYESRSNARDVLLQTGIRKIVETDQYGRAADELESSNVDLLICDAEIENGSAFELVHQVRHSVCGDNPFVVVMSLVDPQDRSSIVDSASAGSDDLVTKPFWAHQLSDRLWTMVNRPRQFMVTESYIGPVRQRKTGVPDTNGTEFDVPNPINFLGGGGQRDDLKAEIEAVALLISDSKVRHDATHIVSLIRGIVGRLRAGETNGAISSRKELIRDAMEDIERRRLGAANGRKDLSELLALALRRLTASMPSPDQKTVLALLQIARAYELAFEPPAQEWVS